MKAPHLETSDPLVKLVGPDIERDAMLGVEWLQGEPGRDTLALMGVADKDNKPSDLAAERARVKSFIERDDQLNWMIQHDGTVVGSVWVDLNEHEGLPPPSVHIMIGDPAMRGKGIGRAAFGAVIDYLEVRGFQTIYSRHLIRNVTVKQLLGSLGFSDFGEAYSDADGLGWQNVRREAATRP